MSIRSLDDVQPGDIMISGMNTAPNKILVYGGQMLLREHFRMGRFAAGHAGVVIPGGKLVEAMPSGARVRDLRNTDWSESHMYFRLQEDYLGQGLDAAHMAALMIGTTYSIMSYAYMGAHLAGWDSDWLENRIDRRFPSYKVTLPSGKVIDWARPKEMICSVLAEQTWTATGKTVIIGTKPQVVTPGMLTRQLYNRAGCIRGGLGFL